MVLVLVALGFKIAAVPFQIWVPDVYQGAPTPVTAFLSVGSKAAGFRRSSSSSAPVLHVAASAARLSSSIAILTLIYGNLAALPQSNLKRLLAYSSIAHAGYLLIGVVFIVGRRDQLLSRRLSAHDATELLRCSSWWRTDRRTNPGLRWSGQTLAFSRLRHVDRNGLARRAFHSPPDFLAKFLIFNAAIQHHQTALRRGGVITVGCGFYYYLKVVRAMYWEDATGATRFPIRGLSRTAMTLLMIANHLARGLSAANSASTRYTEIWVSHQSSLSRAYRGSRITLGGHYRDREVPECAE